MAKKPEPLPTDADRRKVPPKVRPVMIARQKLPDYFPGRTARTWANLAHLKQGPKFFRKGKTTWYLTDDVVDYLTENPVQTSS